MDQRCANCDQVKAGVRNIRGDVKVEPAVLAHHQYYELDGNSPINLCQACINELVNSMRSRMGDMETNELTISISDDEDSTSESSRMGFSDLTGSDSLTRQQQQQDIRQSPDSSSLIASESVGGGMPPSQTISNSSTNSFERARDNITTRRPPPQKRFISDELNALFAKPMPEPVRKRKFAEIQNIPPEDLNDEDVFEMWFCNNIKKQNKERERARKNNRSHRSHSSQSSVRSNVSVRSNNSSISAHNSMSRPLVRQSPPTEPVEAPVPADRRTQAPMISIPEDNESLYSRSSVESIPAKQPRPPAVNKAKEDRLVPQKIDDGNAHSNLAAPRRVTIRDPIVSPPASISPVPINPVLGHKNVGG